MTEVSGRPRDAPLLVIAGPTAAGKTAAALELARHAPIAVVSADSRQVYRRMDVGTAKPALAERSRVPHYGIDVVDPDESFSAYDFVRLARLAMREIRARGQVPVVVGGSGFYIKAVIEGSPLGGVPPDPALRAELEQLAATRGPGALVEYLRRVDPDRAAVVDNKNPRRLIRAIEIARVGRKPGSDSQPRRLAVRILGISVTAEELARRIAKRVDHMYAGGLLEEAERLLAMGYDPALPALSGIGYGEAIAHLRNGSPIQQARERTAARTRQFARRQRTWFRRQLPVNWLPGSEVVPAALAYLEGPESE